MKKLFLALSIVALATSANAQIYLSKTTAIDFFSATPVEDIKAMNKNSTSVLNTANNEMVLQIPISGFKFDKALMEEHFNENYMETPKFPKANFKGIIQEKIDYKKDGTYDVTCVGKMTMHGVEKEETIKGKLTVKGAEITVDVTKHKIALKDYKIEVPKLVVKNISETIDVNMNAVYAPYVKK